MNEISRILTDESTINFIDGTVVKGSNDVSNLIIRCCEEYNNGYIIGLKRALGAGVITGLVLTGIAVGFNIGMKKYKSKKLKNKTEA